MDEVDEIKRRIDIVDLISSYLTLKKAGSNYKALCPFHQEKTPSFMVSPERQIFKCFGCSEGGDAFAFVEKIEGVGFPEALRLLAERVGIKLKSFTPSPVERQKETLFKINSLAADLYHFILTRHEKGRAALEYLKSRGLRENSIKEFGLGFAPASERLATR